MARPTKRGLDYFSLDIQMDDKILLIEAECGLVAFAAIVRLWQKIYSEGYFIEWSEDHETLFAHRNNIDKDTLHDIVQCCFKRDVFDGDMYQKYGILTSHGIQKRYIETLASIKRTNIEIEERFCLIYEEDVLSKITTFTKGKVKETDEIVNIEGVSPEDIRKNPGYSGGNPVISTQKKRKEKKRKESIEHIVHFPPENEPHVQDTFEPEKDEPDLNQSESIGLKTDDPPPKTRGPTPTELNAFFETIWKPYPDKSGKGAVSDTQKKKLYKIGAEELLRALERYLAYVEYRRSTDFPNLSYQNGKTFYRSGYVDFLDANYTPPAPYQPRGKPLSNRLVTDEARTFEHLVE